MVPVLREREYIPQHLIEHVIGRGRRCGRRLGEPRPQLVRLAHRDRPCLVESLPVINDRIDDAMPQAPELRRGEGGSGEPVVGVSVVDHGSSTLLKGRRVCRTPSQYPAKWTKAG